MAEPAARGEHPRDLAQRIQRTSDVVGGAEVDHGIEARVGKGQRSHVAADQLDRKPGDVAGGFVEQLLVDVETDQPCGSALLRDRGERDPAAAAHLQHTRAMRNPEERQEQRHLDALLAPVACLFVGKRPILEVRTGDRHGRIVSAEALEVRQSGLALPAGPTTAPLVQAWRWGRRPAEFLQACRAEYGETFTCRFAGLGEAVFFSAPGGRQGPVRGRS